MQHATAQSNGEARQNLIKSLNKNNVSRLKNVFALSIFYIMLVMGCMCLCVCAFSQVCFFTATFGWQSNYIISESIILT